MDIKKYIASGILEQYVLGQLTRDERKEVESYARQYPEIRQELDSIEVALEEFAMSKQVEPSPGTYEAIQKRIQKTPPSPPQGGRSSFLWGTIAVLALGAALYFYNSSKNSEGALQQQQQQALIDQAACDSLRVENGELQRRLDILRNSGFSNFRMSGSALAPDAVASVIVDPGGQTAYLDILLLPTPPTDKQYQLWALVDGTPVDMGVIEISPDSSFLEVPYIADAGAYAISLEPLGGSVQPTFDQIYVISG